MKSFVAASIPSIPLRCDVIYRLTLGATPSTDVAGVVVGQDLARGRQGAELDVVVESSIKGQTQESNVPPEGQTDVFSRQ